MKIREPLYTMGRMTAIVDPTYPVPDGIDESGPCGLYQWAGLMDPRFTPINKESGARGTIPTFLNAFQMLACDGTPQTLAANNIAAAQALAAGKMTLANTQTLAACVGIPVVPFGYGGAPVTCMALDGGFAPAGVAVTAASTTGTVTAAVAKRMYAGQAIMVGGAGNAAGTIPLVTKVVSINAIAGTFVMADAALKTNAAAPLFQANMFSTLVQQFATPTGVIPAIVAGNSLAFDPTAALARAVSVVSANAGDTTQTITVRGYDVFHQPISETIALNGTTTVNGKKAFKYIASVTGSAVSAGNVTVGTTDIFGINTKTDLWENLDIFFNQAFVTATTGFVAAVATNPATATTGDVRGTYALQTASNGTRRLRIYTSLDPWQLQMFTPSNLEPFFGVTNFTN